MSCNYCRERSRTSRYIRVTERVTGIFRNLAHVIMETGQPKIWCSVHAARQESLLLKRESPFALVSPQVELGPTHTGESSLPDSAYQFTCSSYPQTPSQTHQNNVQINNWAPWLVMSTHSKDSRRREPGGWTSMFWPLLLCLSLQAQVSTSQRMKQGLYESHQL